MATHDRHVVSGGLSGEIFEIIIDNPPVNAGSQAVRAGLLVAIGEAQRSGARAVVIRGSGRNFVSGSDLREFSGPLKQPEWPEIFSAIAACPLPVVAAIDGAALGGGYELALACDARIATPSSLLGLPEVNLGIVPGAGGTQRLPRLTGRAAAIDLVCSARRVSAPEALELGMVDAVSAGDLAQDAMALALSMTDKRPLDDAPIPTEDAEKINAAAALAFKAGRGSRAVKEAVDLILSAGTDKPDVLLAREREIFQELRAGEEAAALRYQFFAERAVAKNLPKPSGAPAIRSVGVVGAGTMGAGLAASLLLAGKAVVLVDASDAALDRGKAQVSAHIVKAGRDPLEAAARLVFSSDPEALAGCELIIEAVVEDKAVKAALFSRLDAILPSSAILASNTSYLDIEDLAAVSGRPERFLGLHFFAPVPQMTLVEVIPVAATNENTLAVVAGLVRAMGKIGVRVGTAEGFLGNRIYAAYRMHCEYLVDDGAMPWDVDKVVRAQGFRMGPFQVGDLSGLDIGWALRRKRDATRDLAERYVDLPDRLYDLGRLGRKTGAGWYVYDQEHPHGAEDPDVEALIHTHRRGSDTIPDERAIRLRALGAILNEAALAFADGTALAPTDIDVVLVNGFGFRREKGGPLWQAARLDAAECAEMIAAVASATGPAFRQGPVERLLDALT